MPELKEFWDKELKSGRYMQRPHQLCTMQVPNGNGDWRDATDEENKAIDKREREDFRMLNCRLGVLCVATHKKLLIESGNADEVDDVSPLDVFHWDERMCAWVYGEEGTLDAKDRPIPPSAIFPPLWMLEEAEVGREAVGGLIAEDVSERMQKLHIPADCLRGNLDIYDDATITVVGVDPNFACLDTSNPWREHAVPIAELVGKDSAVIEATAKANVGCEPFVTHGAAMVNDGIMPFGENCPTLRERMEQGVTALIG